MSAVATIIEPGHDRRRYIGGVQSKQAPTLNEGVVRHLYTTCGMTIAEVAADLGVTNRGLLMFMKRCGIARRPAIKRDQRGERNATWRGASIGYKGAHNRVAAVRGRPQHCEDCGTTDPSKKFEWANLTGKHHDPLDYKRLCRSCHCKFDGLIRNLGEHAKVPR